MLRKALFRSEWIVVLFICFLYLSVHPQPLLCNSHCLLTFNPLASVFLVLWYRHGTSMPGHLNSLDCRPVRPHESVQKHPQGWLSWLTCSPQWLWGGICGELLSGPVGYARTSATFSLLATWQVSSHVLCPYVPRPNLLTLLSLLSPFLKTL